MRTRKVESHWVNGLITLSVFLSLSCGKTNENSNPIPTPSDPTNTPQGPITPPTPPEDTRLPAWIKSAAPIQLERARDYSGLQDLFGIVYPPVVGDPLVAMEIFGDRDRSIIGKIFFGFEDSKGFIFAEMPSVDGAGYRDSNYFDAIYSDDAATVRIVGTLTDANVLSAKFLYRIRNANEDACKRWVVCGGYPYACKRWVDVAACRSYMQTGEGSAVKTLGNFEATKYLEWIAENP